jgi:hypothetical protein
MKSAVHSKPADPSGRYRSPQDDRSEARGRQTGGLAPCRFLPSTGRLRRSRFAKRLNAKRLNAKHRNAKHRNANA